VIAQDADTLDGPPLDVVESLRRRQSKIVRFTLDELIEQYPNDDPPLIDGVVRLGETLNVIASPKVGKTWLVAGMAYSIANGIEWMGYKTNPGRVHVFDCELRPATLRFRYQKVRDAMQVDCSNVHLSSLRGDGRSIVELAKDIMESFEPGEYSCLIWDALYRLLPSGVSENSNEDMSKIYNELDRIAQHTRAANVVIHHSSKGNQAEKSITDVGSGAGSIARSCDTHLVIRPHEIADCAVMEAGCRSFKSPEPVTIRWEFPLWHISMIEPEIKGTKDRRQKIQEESDNAAKKEVLKVLAEAGKPLVQSRLLESISFGTSVSRAKRILHLMSTTDKTIRRFEKRKKGGKQKLVFWQPRPQPLPSSAPEEL